MFIRCPRCGLAFGAPAAGAPCPRCGAPGQATQESPSPAIPPTVATPAFAPPTQVAPIFAAPTRPAPPPAAPLPLAPPHAPTQVWTPDARVAAPYRGPAATEDRGAIAGRAATAAVLSTVSIVGCCNPLGWIGLVLAIRAYAATGDADLAPAAQRAGTARTVALVAFGSTALLWCVSVGLWWFGY